MTLQEFYNFTREELCSHLLPRSMQEKCTPNQLFYSFQGFPGYKFIILDGYEKSIIGGISEKIRQDSTDLVKEKNHNFAAGVNTWFKDLPIQCHRYVPFNGGILPRQLEWLKNELLEADTEGNKCIIFCHMALFVAASREQNLLWNCEEVLEVLHSTPKGTVLACLAGHDHDGGYAVDSHGIHHIVPPSPIECDEGEKAFGEIQVMTDRLKILWTGKRPVKNWPEELILA